MESRFGAWEETLQRQLFASRPAPHVRESVELYGEPIGCQRVRVHADALEFVRLQVPPAFQSSGIGTHLVERLIVRPRESGLPVHLRVLRASPARRLYARLGFRAVELTESHEIMLHDAA